MIREVSSVTYTAGGKSISSEVCDCPTLLRKEEVNIYISFF